MKAQSKSLTRTVSRKDSSITDCNLARLFLFLEVFVDKDIPQHSLK